MSFSNTAGQPDYKLLLFLGKGDIVDGEKTDLQTSGNNSVRYLFFIRRRLETHHCTLVSYSSFWQFQYISVFFRFTELSPCLWKTKIPMTFDLQFEQSDVYYVPGEKSRKKIPSTSSIFLTGVELFPTGKSAVCS